MHVKNPKDVKERLRWSAGWTNCFFADCFCHLINTNLFVRSELSKNQIFVSVMPDNPMEPLNDFGPKQSSNGRPDFTQAFLAYLWLIKDQHRPPL